MSDNNEILLNEALILIRRRMGKRCPMYGHESMYATPRKLRVDCFDPQCINPECVKYTVCKDWWHDADEFLEKVNRD